MKKFRKITAVLATLALLFGVLGSVPMVAHADTTTLLYDFESETVGTQPTGITIVGEAGGVQSHTATVESTTSRMSTNHLKVAPQGGDHMAPDHYVKLSIPAQSYAIKDVTFDYYSVQNYDRYRNKIGFVTNVNGTEYAYFCAQGDNSGLPGTPTSETDTDACGESSENDYSFIGKKYVKHILTSLSDGWWRGWSEETVSADTIKNITGLLFEVHRNVPKNYLLIDDIKITTEAPSTFSVTYNGNGATGGTVPTDSTAYTPGATVTVKSDVPTKSVGDVNYSFEGWSDGEGNTYQGGDQFVINKNTTLTAEWEEIKVYYDVTFNLNGHGTSATPDPQSVAKGGKVVEPTIPTDNTFVFDGWYTNQTCTIKWNFATDTVQDHMILYAKWVSSKDYTSPSNRISGTFNINGDTITAENAVKNTGEFIVSLPSGYVVKVNGVDYTDSNPISIVTGQSVTISKSGMSGKDLLIALGNTLSPDFIDSNKYLRIDNDFSGGTKALNITIPSATYGKMGGYLQAGMKISVRYKATSNDSVTFRTAQNQGKSMGVSVVETFAMNFTTSWQTAEFTLTKNVPNNGDWIPENKSSIAFVFPQTSNEISYFVDDIIVYNSNDTVYAVVDDYESYNMHETLIAHVSECSATPSTWTQIRHPYWYWTGDLTVVGSDSNPHPENLPGQFVPPAKSYECFFDWTQKITEGQGNRRGDRYTAGLGETNLWENAYASNVGFNCTNYYGDFGNYINTNGTIYTGSGATQTINAFNINYGLAIMSNYEGVMLRISALEGNTVDTVCFELKRSYKTANFGVPAPGESSIILLPWSAFGNQVEKDFNFYFGPGVINLVISDMYFYKDPQIDMVLRTNINAAGTTNTLYYSLNAPAGATSAYIDLKSSMPSFYNATVSLIDAGNNVVASKRMDSLTKDWKKYEIQIPDGVSVNKVKVDIDLNSSTAKEMYYVWLNNIGYKDGSGDHDVITFVSSTTQSRAFPVTGAVNNAAGIEYGNGFGGADGTWYGSMWYEADSSRDYSDHGFIPSGEIATAKWNAKNTEVTATNGSTPYASNVVENFKFFTSDNSTLGQEKYLTLWIDSAPSSGYQYNVTNVKAQLFKGSHSGIAADPTALGDLADVITAAKNGTGKIAIKVSRNDEATAVKATAKVTITYVGDATEHVMTVYNFADNQDKDVELILNDSWFVNPDGTLKNIQSINYTVSTDSAANINVGVSEIYTARPNLKVKAHALVLANNISIQYKLPKEIFTETFYKTDGMTVDFAINGKTQNLTLANAIDDGKYFIFTENINYAYEMADDITATIKARYDHEDEMTTTVDIYSVAQYAGDILSDAAYEDDTQLKTLVSDIIAYGTAAQQYIGYKLDKLANENLVGSDQERYVQANLHCDVQSSPFNHDVEQFRFKINIPNDAQKVFVKMKKSADYNRNAYIAARVYDYDTGAVEANDSGIDLSSKISTDWQTFSYDVASKYAPSVGQVNTFIVMLGNGPTGSVNTGCVWFDDIGYVDANGNSVTLYNFNGLDYSSYSYENEDNINGLLAIGGVNINYYHELGGEGGLGWCTMWSDIKVVDGGSRSTFELTPSDISELSAPWSEGKHIAEFGTEVDVKRVIWSGAALALENSTNVRFKIHATSDLSAVPGLYVSVNGEKTPLVFGENIFRVSSFDKPWSEDESKTLLGYVVYVRGFNAKDIPSLTDATYQIGYTGGKARTISTTSNYCTAKYIYNKWNSDFMHDAGTMYLSELVKYVWAYGLSAADYAAR